MDHLYLARPLSSITLTHWEPEVYEHFHDERDSLLLPEMIVAALLYERVFIKDTDLIATERITATLGEKKNLEVFKDLLGTGIFRVLTLRPEKYRRDTPVDDPTKKPMLARSHNIRSLKEQPFRPSNEQVRFYEEIDRILIFNHNVDYVKAFPTSANPFALWLGELLERHADTTAIHEFKEISPEVALKIAKFCYGQESWMELLANSKREMLRPDDGPEFFRSQAYRCLSLDCFPPQPGLLRLIQAVFNTCYCYWQDSDGRFVNGELVEPPVFLAEDEANTIARRVDRLSLSVNEDCISIPIRPGIGNVLLAIRQDVPEFWKLQATLSALRLSPDQDTDSKIRTQFKAVAEAFARTVDRTWPAPGPGMAFQVVLAMLSTIQGVLVDMSLIPKLAGRTVAGVTAMAPVMRNWIQSKLRTRSLSDEIMATTAFRTCSFQVPNLVTRLKLPSASTAGLT